MILDPVTQEIVCPTVMFTGEPPKVVVSISTRCGLPAHVGAVEPVGTYSSFAMPVERKRWLFVVLFEESVAQNWPLEVTVPVPASVVPPVGDTA